MKLTALSFTHVLVKLITEGWMFLGPHFICVASPGHHTNMYLTGGPYLIKGDDQGNATVSLYNCLPTDVVLPRNDFVGYLENVKE